MAKGKDQQVRADAGGAGGHSGDKGGKASAPASAPQPNSTETSQPTLQNIVSTVNLGTRLDLKEIVLRARNTEYNPKRFAAVIMRIRDPKTTALIFSSGKMVVTGAKSEESSRLAARKYAKTINKIGFDVKFHDFKIQNIVGSCDVGFPINLDELALSEHSRFCTSRELHARCIDGVQYEPELFPGLIYRMQSPKVVLLIFVSGKLVVTGAKARTDIFTAFDKMKPVLFQFNKQNPSASALPAS